MFIQHNMIAASAIRSLKNNTDKTGKSMKVLSSGYRINTSADDSAGLTISEKMRWQIRGLNRASDNIQEGVSLVQTADGALQETHSILQRMSELSVQAANDTNTAADRDAIQSEINQLKSEINRIGTDTIYNSIKLFKATNIPQISGKPADILVYHEDYNGTVREGGIIYNGKRYAYDNMNLSYDANGNIAAGTYNVSVENENGDLITIPLMFDGGSRVPSGRLYEIEPDSEGISIDGILHKWETMYSESGVKFDKNNIQKGTYSFEHAGFTISFETKAGTDLDSLINELQHDGFQSYTLQSTDVSTVTVKINPYISASDTTATSVNQNYIPGNKTSNHSSYKMHADDNGIYMYIPSEQSNNQGIVKLTEMTWEDLGLAEFKEGESVNPGSTVSGGELNSVYTYTDSLSGVSISFTIDSEISKGELIDAINNWSISVTTNNKMDFTLSRTAGNTAITTSSTDHSSSLDTYGTQYLMGRTMSQTMTLADGQQLAYDSATDKLSFTMTDANGTSYIFTSNETMSTVTNQVTDHLSSYVNSYITRYQNYLNGVTRSFSAPTASITRTIDFLSDSGGYSERLRYNESFSGWLNTTMLDVTESTDANGIKKYTVAISPDKQTDLDAKAADLANDIVTSLKNTNITIKTDTGATTAAVSAISPRTTKNKRYSSQTIAGDREMKIQSGCLSRQYILIKLPELSTASLGIGSVDVSSHFSASSAITRIQVAIEHISAMRSGFGATLNRLEAAMKVDDITAENTQAAESLIRDADMAEESVAYAVHNILLQCGQSVLAQANENLKDSAAQLLG